MAESRLELADGHLIADAGGRFLLDTGSPVSFSRTETVRWAGRDHQLATSALGLDAEELSNLVGTDLDGLIGGDLLGLHPFTVDLDRVVSMKAAGIRAIDPTADPNTRTRNVYLTLNDPPTAFRLGITVSVTFTRPVAPHVDLPATAILEKDGKSFVWVVDAAKSTVALRVVTVDAREGDNVAVTSGISTGERIVIAGVHSLAEGQPVKVPQ